MDGLKAIILLGGNGRRFQSDLPKQFHRIAGKKVYVHTLEKFLNAHLFEEIILVCHERWVDEVQKEIAAFPSVRVVPGGSTRQESSYLGLRACGAGTRFVVIHDAVRPFVNARILKDNVDYAVRHGAVDTCIPSADTLVHSKAGQVIEAIPTRSEYLRGQTPQSFAYPLIFEAHEHALKAGMNSASDDCSLVVAMGKPVHIVHGEESNLKITSELDLFLAEQLFRLEETSLKMSSIRLQGKKYVITGGSGGIGQALCRELEKEGATALVVSRSSSYSADLTESSQTQRIFEKICEEHGAIDGLINCIGLLKLKNLENLTSEEIETQLNVNLKGLIFSCKWASLKEGGHIVNVASSSYSRGRAGFSIYSSAKAAVVNFTQALAEERPSLLINALVPERTNTSMRQAVFPQEDPATLLPPEKVAQAIVNLLKQDKVTSAIVKIADNI